MARSTARKRALNTLFEADVKGKEFSDMLDERLAYPGAQTPLPDYAIDIVKGVASHRRTIDKAISDTSRSWEVKRMPAIDRNLARIATWEIVYNTEIPAGVAIDEAIALAKIYSDDETPDFLFGILSEIDKKSDDIRLEEIEWQNQRAAEANNEDNSDDSHDRDDQDSLNNALLSSGTDSVNYHHTDSENNERSNENIHFDDLSLEDFKDSSLEHLSEERNNNQEN